MGQKLPEESAAPAARILVIEDNGSDVYLLTRALKKQDLRFELTHLADGEAALAYIRWGSAAPPPATPDLILMDLNLARYTGEEILRAIRGSGRLCHVPVCAWSSSQSLRDQMRLRELGIARFVTKPSGLDQFMEIGAIIRDVLAQARAG